MKKTFVKNTLLVASGVLLATGFGIFAASSSTSIEANITNLVQYLKEFVVTTDGTPSGGELLHVSGSGIVVDSTIIPQESSSDLLALNASGQVVKTTGGGGGGVSVSFGVPTNSARASNALVITSAPSVSELTGKQIVIGDETYIFYSSADGEPNPGAVGGAYALTTLDINPTPTIYGIDLSQGAMGSQVYTNNPTTGNLQIAIGQAMEGIAGKYFTTYNDDFGDPLEAITVTAYLAGTSQNGIVTSTDAPGMLRQNETFTGGDVSGTSCTPGDIYFDISTNNNGGAYQVAGAGGPGYGSIYTCITDGAWVKTSNIQANRDLDNGNELGQGGISHT